MKVWQQIETKIRAGHPYIYLVSPEEERIRVELQRLAGVVRKHFTRWSAYNGFEPEPPASADADNPIGFLETCSQPTFLVLHDFHLRMREEWTMRQLIDLRSQMRRLGHVVVVTAPRVSLPVEVQKQFAVLEVPLPDVDELLVLYKQVARYRTKETTSEFAEIMARAAKGLTAEEANLAFRQITLNTEQTESEEIRTVIAEKRRLLEADGVLEFFDPEYNLEDIGGLAALKSWLQERSKAFDESARAFGLPEPKGMLLLGVQGCGKSLSARCVAGHWNLPLVRLDLGALRFGGKAPEETLRQTLRTLEALSPLVLWIDEIEKGFAGTGGENVISEDQRVLGYFLTWLQEKEQPVFVVSTANDVSKLPPELLRKGRFDEIFFVDLPDEQERRDILTIHLDKRGVSTLDLDLDELAEVSRNFTGAELEQAVIDSLYRAFGRNEGVTREDLIHTIQTSVPLYRTSEEQIKALRDWCQDRARQASQDTSLMDLFQKES